MKCRLPSRKQSSVCSRQASALRVVLFWLSIGSKSGAGMMNSESTDVINGIRDKHLRILVVDDEDRFRKSMAINLRRKYGAQVEEAESGPSAIEKIKNGNTYDLIFMDIMMPEMTGVQTYRELRSRGNTSRIVIMSAFSNSDEWHEAEGLGVILLHKPIPEINMIDILKSC